MYEQFFQLVMTSTNPKIVSVTWGVIHGICGNAPEIILSNQQYTQALFEKGMEQLYSSHIFIKLYVAMAWSSLFESANRLKCLNLLSSYFYKTVTVLLELMKTKECSESNWI